MQYKDEKGHGSKNKTTLINLDSKTTFNILNSTTTLTLLNSKTTLTYLDSEQWGDGFVVADM